MPKDIEILPPVRVELARPRPVTITARVPGVSQHGAIEAYFAGRRYDYTTKTMNKLTTLNNAEASLYNAQTAVIVAKVKRDDELFLLQEAPERRGHELQLRRIERANQLREYQHHYEVNEIRRREEITHADARLTKARAGLVEARTVLRHAERGQLDANQAYEAQEKYGSTTHAIGHKKQQNEMLELQLDEAAKRKLLRKLQNEEPDEDEVLDELYARRERLLARGRDTTRIDEEIEQYENSR